MDARGEKVRGIHIVYLSDLFFSEICNDKFFAGLSMFIHFHMCLLDSVFIFHGSILQSSPSLWALSIFSNIEQATQSFDQICF